MEMNITHTTGMQWIAKSRQHQMTIDLPPVYNGEDTGPMSAELLVAALASCAGAYALLYLKKQELPTEGLGVSASWEDAESPLRIGKITINIKLPESISPEHAQMALKYAGACKMHNTLLQKPEISFALAE